MPRPAGVPNKNRRSLQARLAHDFPNYNAIIEMARIGNDEDQPMELRFQAHKEVAKYCWPQLKAVDVSLSGEDGGPIEHRLVVSFKEAK